jgi:hypothetical protein
MGEDVSVLVAGLLPCGTGHFISFDSFDTFCSSVSFSGREIPHVLLPFMFWD